MQDIVEYRLSHHDMQIENIRKHNHDVNESLINLNVGLSSIKKSIEGVVTDCFKLEDEIKTRISILEDDLKIRNYRNKIVSSFLSNWRTVLIVASIIFGINFQKFLNVLSIIRLKL